MKKKAVLALGLSAILIAAVALGISTHMNREQKPFNPARRDGEVTVVDVPEDDQLSLVSGEEDSGLGGSFSEGEQGNAGKGSSSENQSAKEIVDQLDADDICVINEALTVSDAGKEAFFANGDFKDITPIDSEYLLSTPLPSKYDARNDNGKCYVTAPEDQGYSYLCWAYAAIGAIESDILKNHEDISYKNLNLSEKHLAYYNVHKTTGSVGGYIDDDYRELVNPDNEENAWIFDYDTGYVAVGGVTDYCISLLTAWKGPVYEKGNNAFKSIYGSEYLFKDNKDKPSGAYDADFHVQGVSQVRGDISNNELIKRMILKHGAVTAGVNSAEKFWKNSHRSLYSFFEDKKIPTADHEISIIGWDDDYSAANFSSRPFGNGAWLCKNSWGDTAGDKGFFYLSYYDDTLSIDSISAYSVAAKSDSDFYDNNYQVAGFLTNLESTLDDSLNTVFAYKNTAKPYAVMYEAQADEVLKAFGFMSLDCYGQYEAEIYKNAEVTDGKIDLNKLKEPVYAQKISAVSAGFHTFPIDAGQDPDDDKNSGIGGIELKKGDTFLVVIKPVREQQLVFEAAADNISPKNYDEWKNLTGSFENNYSASGNSYYLSDDNAFLESQSDKDFFIKAYTNFGEQTFENADEM